MQMLKMPSQTSQGAVSEYEHILDKRVAEMFEESDTDDSLPLKPPDSRKNINNCNIYRPGFQIDDLFSKTPLPIPSAWSPGTAPKPSVNLTPLKSTSQKEKNLLREILEPFDTNQVSVPVPTALENDIICKPNPTIFITPEKTISNASKCSVKDNVLQSSNETKENFKDKTHGIRSKRKFSVRFDVPSVSSCEEINENEFSRIDSPIVLKGKEIGEELSEHSPTWKSFSPQKSYDPFIYTDDSVLDDSLPLDSLGSHGKNNLEQETDVICEEPFLKSSNSQVNQTSESKKENPKRKFLKKNTGANCLTRKSLTIKSKDSSNSKTVKTLNKRQTDASNTSLDFLKTDVSQYEKKPPKPCIIRESKNKHEEADYAYPFDTSSGDLEFEHAFARPEYNSTLRVRAECNELESQEVDVETALIDTLRQSEMLRTEVNEKASMLTNRPSKQFNNLVSLDTSTESLCERIVRMRVGQVKAKHRTYQSFPNNKSQAPDLMEFFSPDLQKESPDLSLPGVTPVTSGLKTAPLNTAFDLYRHNRLWSGINDF